MQRSGKRRRTAQREGEKEQDGCALQQPTWARECRWWAGALPYRVQRRRELPRFLGNVRRCFAIHLLAATLPSARCPGPSLVRATVGSLVPIFLPLPFSFFAFPEPFLSSLTLNIFYFACSVRFFFSGGRVVLLSREGVYLQCKLVPLLLFFFFFLLRRPTKGPPVTSVPLPTRFPV